MSFDQGKAEAAFSAVGVPSSIGPFRVLVIGASFGGPPVVESILEALPDDFRLPVAVCQHITEGFTAQWAERLSKHCKLPVAEARHRDRFDAGRVYIAPTGTHLGFRRIGDEIRIRLDEDETQSLHVPSIDNMMTSAADIFGSGTLGVLLTGLGQDGASGMLDIRKAGGYTICESAATAKSYSMPGSATKLGACVEELGGESIPARVVKLGQTR